MQRNHPQHHDNRYDDFPIQGDDSIYNWLPESHGQSFVFHSDAILISRDVLKRKYFEAFNFYFSKPINEILANLSLPHVIMYKDYLYYDDESEYLKRYYRLDETAPRLLNLSKFYNNTSEGLSKPNLAVHEQNKIILKRNNKLHKYYLSKLENFADIPQTQRNHKAKDDFKILNNLHDDDGLSEDIYRHEERKAKLKEEPIDRVIEDDDVDVIHNSFQKMMEQYENATAKVSFDSTQHNVYDPENSSASQLAVENKSEAENISFEESIELYAKGLNKGNKMLEKHDTRATEKTHAGTGDTEDQIPHNMSDFALSDASELNLINEMMKNSKEERLVGRLINNVETRGYKEKVKAMARQAENTEVEKEREKNRVVAVQKINISKSKSTSTAVHQANKQQENFAKTAKTSIEKPKTPKEYNQEDTERPPKSLERYKHRDPPLEKTASQPSARTRDELLFDKSQPSSRNFDIQEKLSPRDLQYPIISIKNIQVKPVEGSIKDHPLDYRSNTMPYDDRTFPSKQKTVPQMIKKSLGKKLSVPGETKTSAERSLTSTEPNQGIKGLMEKYQRQPEEGVSNKSKVLTKDASMGNKSKGNLEEIVDKYQKMGDLYVNNDLYTRVAQKTEPKSSLQLNRAKTDDITVKSKKPSKESPTRVFETQPSMTSSMTRRVVLSPTSPRKEKLLHRFSSNEGLSPRLLTSGTGKITTQLSDHSKSIAEAFAEDKPLSASATFKSVKVEKVFAYKRTEMKPPMKTNLPKTEVSTSNNSNTRRLTAAHTGSGTPSVDKNEVISVPVSPTKKFDLKLNLNKLNQLPGKFQDSATENSYGFWSSRSAKLPADEESRLRQGLITDDRYRYDSSSKKDYMLKKNYDPYADVKKKEKPLKKGGSFRDPQTGQTQGYKIRESDVHRNPTLLKSSTHETEMNPVYTQDVNEMHSGRSGKLRDNEIRFEVNLTKSNEHRRPSKK